MVTILGSNLKLKNSKSTYRNIIQLSSHTKISHYSLALTFTIIKYNTDQRFKCNGLFDRESPITCVLTVESNFLQPLVLPPNNK